MFSPTLLLFGALLVLVQLLAAIPWASVVFLRREERSDLLRNPLGGRVRRVALGLLAVAIVLPVVFTFLVQDRASLERVGRYYGAVLQLQLILDFFIIGFFLLLKVWPKGGAVAQAAFREGIRQPMYWLLTGLAFFAILISPFIPYFTFGEDHLVVKQLGYDTLMLVAVIFGCLAASMFVGDEIEGRTAITLMSKPVSRRQFLIGKYVGIVLAALLMVGLVGTFFEEVLVYKRWLDKLDPEPTPAWITAAVGEGAGEGTLSWLPPEARDFLRGVGLWANHTFDTLPGMVLCFCQVMVLVSIAVALATRVPMVVNLVTVLVVYFLAHLTPVLVTIGQKARRESPDSAVAQLLAFTAQVFDTILPGLEFFRVGDTMVSDTPLPLAPFLAYVGSVTVYGLLYTVLVILFGLILFEDRDLA